MKKLTMLVAILSLFVGMSFASVSLKVIESGDITILKGGSVYADYVDGQASKAMQLGFGYSYASGNPLGGMCMITMLFTGMEPIHFGDGTIAGFATPDEAVKRNYSTTGSGIVGSYFDYDVGTLILEEGGLISLPYDDMALFAQQSTMYLTIGGRCVYKLDKGDLQVFQEFLQAVLYKLEA